MRKEKEMPQKLHDIEHVCHEIGARISHIIEARHGEKRVGFALLMFDFGPGGLTYISNAKREDMVAALFECAAALQAGEDQPPITSEKRQLRG